MRFRAVLTKSLLVTIFRYELEQTAKEENKVATLVKKVSSQSEVKDRIDGHMYPKLKRKYCMHFTCLE